MTARASVLWLLMAFGCTPQGDPAIGPSGFSDDFERDSLGELWHNTGGPYEVREGALHVRGARNKPLWLRRTLPRDVRIELTARSDSPDGDIKLEVFGDGVSSATTDSYTATSYVVIFGGWNNTKNLIARLDEHGDDRQEGPERRVEMGHVYHLKIERRGDTIRAFADGHELASFQDDDPLEGRDHSHFGFNNWASDLTFDDLRITPL